MSRSFEPLADKPDHPALERAVLAWWEEERVFDRLREQNRGAERFSFVDGPITANNPMGVHHAWGRTLKDVFQRYKALGGFDQRYQNGFDCQGLSVGRVQPQCLLDLDLDPQTLALGGFDPRYQNGLDCQGLWV